MSFPSHFLVTFSEHPMRIYNRMLGREQGSEEVGMWAGSYICPMLAVKWVAGEHCLNCYAEILFLGAFLFVGVTFH
jgi:hypothetical protein